YLRRICPLRFYPSNCVGTIELHALDFIHRDHVLRLRTADVDDNRELTLVIGDDFAPQNTAVLQTDCICKSNCTNDQNDSGTEQRADKRFSNIQIYLPMASLDRSNYLQEVDSSSLTQNFKLRHQHI